uniref:Uncharacterized protein n=1 Tax=Chenopodium quinoa TaxID=63459 RepID=A0A803MDE3_CHEQI
MSWRGEIISTNYNAADQAQILAIPLSYRNTNDRMYWWPSRCGEYSVKSGYWIAKQGPAAVQRQPYDEIWRIIWGLKLAQFVEETVIHAIFECKAAKEIWAASNFTQLVSQAPTFCFRDRLLWLASKSTSNELKSMATLAWAAWWCRNKAIF